MEMILDNFAPEYLLLSNDPGFLGSWGKRTQLARFIPGDSDQSTMEIPGPQKEWLSNQRVKIALQLDGLENETCKLVRYRFDDTHSHAYASWLQMGKPEDPSRDQYRMLSEAMEPGSLSILI